jgi:hypothetical protein
MYGSDTTGPGQYIESNVVVVNAQKPAKAIDFFGQRDVSVGSRNYTKQAASRKYSVPQHVDTETSKLKSAVAGSSMNVQQNFQKVNNHQTKWSINDAPNGFFDVSVKNNEQETKFKYYNLDQDASKRFAGMATSPTTKIYSNGGHTYERPNVSYNYPNVPNSPKVHPG